MTREYVKKLSKRYDALSSLQNRIDYGNYTLPLHEMMSSFGSLKWTVVDLLLSKFPPNMAKQALMWEDGDFPVYPLHMTASAAMKAPQSTDTIVKMLALAPEADFKQDCRGMLPLSYAISSQNTTAVELLTKAYPKGLFVKDNNMNDPIWNIFCDEELMYLPNVRIKIFYSSIKGLLTGLSNSSLYSDMEMITSIISIYFSRAIFSFREIVNKFIEQHENGDNCNLCQMLLRLYCFVSRST